MTKHQQKILDNAVWGMHWKDLARKIYPDPESWNMPMQGGPPGCMMAIKRSIYRMNGRIDEDGRIYIPKQETK